MDLADREKLEKLALERLYATADDDEPWSFVFRTDGAFCLFYCPWSETEDWEFDGEIEGLGLPWSPERLKLIKRGEADPTEEELQIAGYALFVGASEGDPDEAPMPEGVFDSLEEAKAALTEKGAVASLE